MVLKRFEKEIGDTEREAKLIDFLNDTIDTLNRYFAQETNINNEVGNLKLNEIRTTGFYHGINTDEDGFPNDIQEYSLLVIESENGITQVLFSNRTADFRVYARCIIDGKTSNWKEL